MDIRTNTPSYANKPVFGMAFVKPQHLKYGARISTDKPEAVLKSFEKVVYKGKNKKLMNRAIRQLKGELAGSKHYDIRYVALEQGLRDYEVQVVSKAGDIVKTFDEQRLHGFKSSKKMLKNELEIYKCNYDSMPKIMRIFDGVRLISKIIYKGVTDKLFHPKEFLPAPFLAAANYAKVLEKEVATHEKNISKINTIFKEG